MPIHIVTAQNRFQIEAEYWLKVKDGLSAENMNRTNADTMLKEDDKNNAKLLDFDTQTQQN